MATPEQNTLLGLQLFQQPVAQFNQQNDARTNLLLRLLTMQREDQLKRDLASQGYDKAIEVANIQADRADRTSREASTRQGTQLEAMQTREDTRATEAERRQKAALEARDKADVLNEIDKLYPQYAAAAARAGKEISQRTDFPETRAGLGQLAAELRTAEVGYETRRFEGAADAAVSELTDAHSALAQAKKRLDSLSMPSPRDEKFARENAIKALQRSIESGELVETAKLKPKAIQAGIAALAKGDETIARTLLGDEAMTAFTSAIDQTLMALPNTKARLQERAQAQQQLLQLQTSASRIESDLRKGAAANPVLADRMKTLRTSGGLQDLMAPPETPTRAQRTFDQITPPPATATPDATTGDGATPSASTDEPGIFSQGFSRLMDVTPGARTAQRIGGSVIDSVRAPENLNDYSRVGQSLLRLLQLSGGSTATPTAAPVPVVPYDDPSFEPYAFEP